MADTDRNEWRLYDTDLTTQLSVLPAVSSHIYLEANEPGSGELKISLDTLAATQVTEGMLCVCYYRGAARASFFVDNLKHSEADASEGAGRMMSLSGRGGMGLLEMARVKGNAPGEGSREYTAQTKASILISMIEEAQTRGGLAALTWDFTDTDDTDSTAWTDSEDLSIPVGTTLLAVLRQFSRAGEIDFSIAYSSGGFVLSAYKDGIGTNKATTVFMRVGSNCEEVSRDTRGGKEVENALNVKYKEGYVDVEDATSIALRGRREGFLSLEAAQSSESAITFASAKLEQTKDPQESIAIRVWDGVKPYLFVDYVLGDTVSLDSFGVENSYRVLGIQADFDGDEWSHVVLETNSILYENDLRMARDLEWLLNQWNTARDTNLLETRQWVALGLPTDVISRIEGLFMDGDTLYVAGNMTTIGGLASNNFSSYNMVTGAWNSYGEFPFTSGHNCVCVVNGEIYVAGDNQNIFHWNGTSFDSIGAADVFESIFAMATDGTDLYIGGDFSLINSVANTKGVARFQLSDSSWHALGAGLTGSTVYALLWDTANSRLIIGGNIPAHDNICAWNGSSYDDFDTGLDDVVRALTLQGVNAIAGGDFTDFISSWDGVVWTTIPGITDIVRGLAVYLTDIYVTGDFTEGILRYSGGVFYSIEGGLNGQGYAVVMYGSTVIVGGDNITLAGDVPVNNLAAYFTNFESLADYLTNAGSTYDLGAGIHGAKEKTTLADADEFPLWDSVTSLLRKITWVNIKAALAKYLVLSTGATAMAFATNGTVKVTPNANHTYTTTVPPAGETRRIIILTSGTSSYTITFGSGFKSTGTLATGTVSAQVFVIAWISDGTNLYEQSRTVAMAA